MLEFTAENAADAEVAEAWLGQADRYPARR